MKESISGYIKADNRRLQFIVCDKSAFPSSGDLSSKQNPISRPLLRHNLRMLLSHRPLGNHRIMARTTETRFVIIIHNPITMARMNRLFGVTMAEQGGKPTGNRGSGNGRADQGSGVSARKSHSEHRPQTQPDANASSVDPDRFLNDDGVR